MGWEGAAAGYNGCAALSGYLLQQKLKHSCSRLSAYSRFFIMLCTLQSTAYANFFLQQLLFLQWLGSADLCRENLLLLGYTGPVQADCNGYGARRSLVSMPVL